MSRSRCDVWAVGEMLCLNCGRGGDIHTWLLGTEPVECPSCGEMFCVPIEPKEEE